MPEPRLYVIFKDNDAISDRDVDVFMQEQNMRFARPLTNPDVAAKIAKLFAEAHPHETIALYTLCEFYEPQPSVRKTPGKEKPHGRS